MRKEIAAGFATTVPTVRALQDLVGEATLSRVGVIVKTKGGKVKVRLVHDLSRSGVNHKIRLPERIVLPRLSDWIEDALRVQQAMRSSDDSDWECLNLDHADAYNELWIDLEEVRHLGGRALGVVFAYLVLLF